MGLQTNKIIDIPLNIPHYSIIYMAKQSRAPTAGGLPGKGKISARIASGDAWLVASSREKNAVKCEDHHVKQITKHH